MFFTFATVQHLVFDLFRYALLKYVLYDPCQTFRDLQKHRKA